MFRLHRRRVFRAHHPGSVVSRDRARRVEVKPPPPDTALAGLSRDSTRASTGGLHGRDWMLEV
jgi:hypothetical protein